MLSRFVLLVLGLFTATALQAGEPPVFVVTRFGAVGDGATLNTAALNRAVDAAAAVGGATVVVPAGRFLTGTVRLRSHVKLQLEPGAVLVGSTDIRDYPENPAPAPTDTDLFRRILHVYPSRLEFGRFAIIAADGESDVSIVGEGVIEGQGDHPNFSKKELRARGLTQEEAHARRPFGLSFVRCRNVRVEGITLRNLASWCQSYLDCDGVRVQGVSVDSYSDDRNNDGIDIDGCRDVLVANCRFETGDDAICLKSSFRVCEGIVITNCVCRSRSNGLKFGTASNGGFRNVNVSNLTMRDVAVAGIAIQVVDGGTVDGIVISNITMDRVGAAIFVRLGDRGRKWLKPADHAVGTLRNVAISHVFARVFTPFDGRPLASSISGLPGYEVENITLTDIRLVMLRKHTAEETVGLSKAAIPEAETDYPEYSMFGSLPAYGLYVRHARAITLERIDVSFLETDYRSALFCEDTADLTVRGWRTRSLPESEAVHFLRDVTNARISDYTAPHGTGTFLRLEGKCADIVLDGVDLQHARLPVSLGPEVPASSVREAAARFP